MSEFAERPKALVRRPVAAIVAIYEATRRILPGACIAVLVAMSAMLVTEHQGGPVMLMALLMGMAVGFLREDLRLQPGLVFSGRSVLRFGVALLGARITVQYLADLGWMALLVVIGGVVLSIATGICLARLFGRSSWFGILTGGAVGICGASAAAALSAVLPRHAKSDADTAVTIIGVTALSTMAMVAYPILSTVVGLDDRATGFFLGVTIHDVAQVVGAGYSVSDQAGNLAVIVKLFRVLMLVPVILIVTVSARLAIRQTESARLGVPGFVVGFALLIAAGSLGLIPAEIGSALSSTSRWCLIIAMAAIGINTSLGEIRRLGYRPAVILIGATIVIGAFGLAAAILLFAPGT